MGLEWTGDCKDAGEHTPEPLWIDEKAKYGQLIYDNPSPGVIMFVYGVAF